MTNTGVSISRSLWENVNYEFVLTIPVLLILLGWFTHEMGDKWPFYKVLFPGFVQNSMEHPHVIPIELLFFPSVSLKSKWCSCIVVLTRLQLERIPILFHLRSNFHEVVNPSTYAFPTWMLASLSVDEIIVKIWNFAIWGLDFFVLMPIVQTLIAVLRTFQV